MSYVKFRKNVLEHLSTNKNKKFGELPASSFRGNRYSHILPKELRDLNIMKFACKISEKICYHTYSHHLNSSQMMCINFFNPILNESNILVSLISTQLGLTLPKKAQVKERSFEYCPNGNKCTNFDFFLELTTSEKIYFEIKYTEKDFGSISNSKTNIHRYGNG